MQKFDMHFATTSLYLQLIPVMLWNPPTLSLTGPHLLGLSFKTYSEQQHSGNQFSFPRKTQIRRETEGRTFTSSAHSLTLTLRLELEG